jgi:hypothetical protein
MRTIEVLVSPKGEVTVTTKGFAGSTCQSASQELERALGLRQSERLTSEFYQQQASNEQQLKEGT